MTYPDRSPLLITVNAVDITEKIDPESISISSVLTSETDECSFEIIDAGALGLQDWQEVIITNTITSVKLFAGYVLSGRLENASRGVQIDAPAVRCVDYGGRLDYIRVKKSYITKTDLEIIQDIFTTYCPEFNSSTYVVAVKTYSAKRFNRQTVRAIIDDLAKAAGASWYIDYNKNLHFFLIETYPAPFSLTDVNADINQTTVFPYSGLQKSFDGAGLANRVEIVGGTYLSSDTTDYLDGTGNSNKIVMPFRAHAPAGYTAIRVWRNDGSDSSPIWTELTVKTGYIDTLGATSEVLHYFEAHYIEQQNSFPNLRQSVKITVQYEIPLRTRYQDNASFAQYGKYFDHVISDQNITDKATAKIIARGFLASNSLSATAYTFSTLQSGLRAGMTIDIKSTSFGFDSTFVIQKVEASFSAGGYAEYEVSVGVYSPSLFSLISDIARNAKPIVDYLETEVLDEIQLTEETIIMSETHSVTAVTPTYKWGSDANQFIWDFFTWA
jgi:hypothetical protein